jgi:O-antigen/teichoic acid export membrane protein
MHMKKVSRNFLSLFFSDGITRLIGFAATVYIARVLAVEGFGLINYGLAFISYALLFANPGLTIIGAREVAKTPQDRGFIEEILGLRIVLAIAIFVIFFFSTILIPGSVTTKRIIIIYALALFPFAVLLEFVFQGREDMAYVGAGRVIQYGLYLAIVLLFLKHYSDILIVPVAFVVSYVLSTAFLIVVYVRKYKTLSLRFSIPRWRTILSLSIPVGVAVILNQVTISLPPIVLGIFKTSYDVGIFSAGYKIVFMLLIIERVFYYVFFPILSRQHEQNPEKLAGSFNFLTRFLFALTIPITVGGLILAPGIIAIIYGQPFQEAVGVLRILMLYFMIVPINTIFGYGLIAIDQERRFFRIITVTALINVVLIAILGLQFGFHGAALALLVSESVSIVLMNGQLKKYVRFGKWAYIMRPLAAALVMAMILYLLQKLHSVVLFLLGTIVYLLVFYLVGGFSRTDLKNIKDVFVARSEDVS